MELSQLTIHQAQQLLSAGEISSVELTRATLERIEPDPDYAFINSMAKKYLNEDRYPWLQPGEERVVLYFRPEHTSQMG